MDLNKAQTRFYACESNVQIGDRSLLEICQTATPPCRLNPLLANGHLQTCWTAIEGSDVPIHYKRKIFEAEDQRYAGSFAVDFVVSTSHPHDGSLPPRTTVLSEEDGEHMRGKDSTPMVIMLHGLSGGSHEIYLRHVVEPLKQLGWHVCVVNSRGCAMSKLTSSTLYNARATWDVRQTINWLRTRYPHRPLFAIGYSLGANILVNYLGETSATCPLKAAVVLSNPWNLEACALHLNRTWLGRQVYSATMAASMKGLLKRHAEEVHKGGKVDVERALQAKFLHDFDRELQCPAWGYPTEGAYYRDASCIDSLLAVRVPLFAINAIDDPIATAECLPLQEVCQNRFVVMCTTSWGGHLSWFEWGGSRWFPKPVVGFLRAMVDPEVANGGGSEQNSAFSPMRRKMGI